MQLIPFTLVSCRYAFAYGGYSPAFNTQYKQPPNGAPSGRHAASLLVFLPRALPRPPCSLLSPLNTHAIPVPAQVTAFPFPHRLHRELHVCPIELCDPEPEQPGH